MNQALCLICVHWFRFDQLSTVIAEVFVRDLISYFSYFRLKIQNLVAYENNAHTTVYATPSSLYENL